MNRSFLEEHVTHGTVAFPVGIYDAHFTEINSVLFPVHYHKEFEILVVTGGKIKLQLEGDIIYLNCGEGIFINSGTLHSAVQAEAGECSFIALVFSPDFIAAEHEELYEKYIRAVIKNEITVPRELPHDIIPLACKTNALFKSADFGYELFIKSNLIRMLALCVSNAKRSSCRKNDGKTNIVKAVLEYIHHNYANEITLQDLADYAHISKEHLCRIFRDIADSSPITYLNRYRIIESTHMLRSTNQNISEIASACGFNNSSYFNKLFLRFMKCSPTEYRRNIYD